MVAGETLPDLDQARPLDAASEASGYLITDERYGSVRLSVSAFRLLQAVQAGASWEELAERARQQGQSVSATDVQAAYDRVVTRLFKLRRRGKPSLPTGFWLRRQLVDRAAVRRVADWLTPLFSPWITLVSLGAILIALGDHLRAEPIQGLFDGAILWPAYLLFIVSLIGHEFGHATACHRLGAPPDDIGFTIYWIFPAFYSDVTAAWQLDRRQRMVVDLGGIYFQLLVGAAYWFAYRMTDWLPLAAAFGLILVGCLFALNPFFKLDGYWLLSDALGVPRLSRQPARLWRHAVVRFRGQSSSHLPWPRWVTIALAIYAPASLLFFLFFIGRLLPELGARITTYPELISSVAFSLMSSPQDSMDLLPQLLTSTFLILVCGLMLHALVQRLLGILPKPWRLTPAPTAQNSGPASSS